MTKLRKAAFAGAGLLVFAGVAAAATSNLHTMTVPLPDGGSARITYAGDVAPKVAIEQAQSQDTAYADPFAEMDRDFARVAAMAEAQHRQAMQQIADMQARDSQSDKNQVQSSAVIVGSQPGQLVVSGTMPPGSSYSYSVVSSSDGKASCTQSVEWHSGSSGQEPQVTRASSGDCGTVKGGEGNKPVPAALPHKAAPLDPRSI